MIVGFGAFLLAWTLILADRPSVNLTETYGIHQVYNTALGDSTLCLLDETEYRLYFLDIEGRKIADAGRKGQGPGEMSDVLHLFYSKSHRSFVVWDQGQRTLHLWSPAGKYLQGLRLAGYPGMPVAFENGMVTTVDSPYGKGEETTVTLLEPEGTTKQKWSLPGPEDNLGTAVGGGRRFFRWDYMPRRAAGAGLLAFCQPSSPDVWLLSLTNGRRRKVTVDMPITLIRGEDLPLRGKTEANARIRRQYDGKPYPVINSMMVDAADRAWLFGHKRDGHYPLRVIDEKGHVILKSVLAQVPVAIGRERLYFLENSEEDHLLLTWMNIEQCGKSKMVKLKKSGRR